MLAVPPGAPRRPRRRCATATASSSPTSARSPATAGSSCATARRAARPRRRVPPRRPPAAGDARRARRRPPRRRRAPAPGRRRPGRHAAAPARPSRTSPPRPTSSTATTTRSAAPPWCARWSASPATAPADGVVLADPGATDRTARHRHRRQPVVRRARPGAHGARRRRRGDPQRRRRRRRPRPGRAARQLLVGRPAPRRPRSATWSRPCRAAATRRSPTRRRSSAARTRSTTSTSAPTATATPCRRRSSSPPSPTCPTPTRCVTPDLKQAGDVVVLVGRTSAEFGGSHLDPRRSGEVPPVGAPCAGARPDAPDRYRRLHRAMRDGLVARRPRLQRGRPGRGAGGDGDRRPPRAGDRHVARRRPGGLAVRRVDRPVRARGRTRRRRRGRRCARRAA